MRHCHWLVAIFIALAPLAAAAEEMMFFECTGKGYCAGVTPTGEFFAGSNRPDGDPLRWRRNIFDHYGEQGRVGVRMVAFRMDDVEWCVGIDSKGRVYMGDARQTPESFRQR